MSSEAKLGWAGIAVGFVGTVGTLVFADTSAPTVGGARASSTSPRLSGTSVARRARSRPCRT
jgi:hypothetical protein